MIRELAENPNVHQPLSRGPRAGRRPGRALRRLPRQRHRRLTAPPCSASASQPDEVDAGGRGDSRAAPRARSRRQRMGARRVVHARRTSSSGSRRSGSSRTRTSRSRSGWCSRGRRRSPEPPGTSARRVGVGRRARARHAASSTRRSAATPTRSASSRPRPTSPREGEIGSTFLAFVDGEPVAAGYASYTPLGLLLFGGATLPSARGRGAYRALVAARAREAADRGTPVLVTHAGQMSRPILERLGFKPVSRIDRLLDVFPA